MVCHQSNANIVDWQGPPGIKSDLLHGSWIIATDTGLRRRKLWVKAISAQDEAKSIEALSGKHGRRRKDKHGKNPESDENSTNVGCRTVMSKAEYPITPAVRFLRERKVDFIPRLYQYQEHGGTRVGARELGLPEHILVKTLVMETEQHQPLLVLMHGDCEVSTKKLARILGVKSVAPCDERTATRLTGYIFGGTSPFGTHKPLHVYVEESVFDLPRILINGGKRGFLVEIAPHALRETLSITEVEVAIRPEGFASQ
jgi:Cys-tRNA(Pro) deacylase